MAIIRGTLQPGKCITIMGMQICNKWTKRTAEATEDYKQGVKNPKRSWCEECASSGERYKTNVDAAHKRNAFAKGVKKIGSAGWATRTLLKGPTRFAQGVAGAGGAYEKGFGPYHRQVPSIQMPNRYPRGDPRNLDRVKAMSTAFGRKKVELAGTGGTSCS